MKIFAVAFGRAVKFEISMVRFPREVSTCKSKEERDKEYWEGVDRVNQNPLSPNTILPPGHED